MEDPNSGKLAYFYCNRSEDDRRKPEMILRGLIHQLVQSEGDKLLSPIVEIYDQRLRDGQRSSQLSIKECQDLLVRLIDGVPRTNICLDALDEVDPTNRKVLLQSIKGVMKASNSLVKVFATSRRDPDILRHFEIFPRIELESDDNTDDINCFLDQRICEVIDDGDLLMGEVTQDLEKRILQDLGQRSKGM